MQVFDAHTHIFPDKIAESVVDRIAQASGVVPAYNGTREGLVNCLKESGIDGALNCPIATKPEQVESINRWALNQHQWPVVSLGSMHPDYEKKKEMLVSLKEEGLPGIKMHPEYQGFRLDEERVKEIWEVCRQLQLIVFLHAGADVAFEAPYHSRPSDFAWLIREFPRLQVVAAHLGGWRMWEEVEESLIGKDIFLETSFSLGFMSNPESAERMLKAHSRDLLMFGSDAPWGKPAEELEYLNSLRLPDELKARILWGNAARLFNFS